MKKRNCLIFLLPLFFAGACSSEVPGSVDTFADQVNEQFEADVFIPEFEEYPVTSAEIQTVPLAGTKELLVTYSGEKGELKSEEHITNHEETVGSDVLYGIYDGEPFLFRLSYDGFEAMSGDGNTETLDIDGTEVQYSEAEDGGNEFLKAFFNTEEGSYSLEFALSEELTREKAFEIVETVVDGANS
ncbi:hypothetical protein [Planococcus lenghuensis]|uniref:DUF4367 domain-containing protein n=1 Tax=Planococcus lenghuensis TaxID=2213202 RepID=A0A1Q2KZK0_9BACL|nr:hypothetical protein [Planococcus lenghuensis]AQQ53554.1 hypothetical protein B0X71_11035 [Planococcus lenghuensis]